MTQFYPLDCNETDRADIECTHFLHPFQGLSCKIVDDEHIKQFPTTNICKANFTFC
jgi:hypothetical protein